MRIEERRFEDVDGEQGVDGVGEGESEKETLRDADAEGGRERREGGFEGRFVWENVRYWDVEGETGEGNMDMGSSSSCRGWVGGKSGSEIVPVQSKRLEGKRGFRSTMGRVKG